MNLDRQDPKEILIGSLTKDLPGTPEKQLLWKSQCAACLEVAKPADVSLTNTLLRKWHEQTKAAKSFLRWRPFIVFTIALAVQLALGWHIYRQFEMVRDVTGFRQGDSGSHGSGGVDIARFLKDQYPELSEDELLLVFGDPEEISSSPKATLHKKYPENIAYLTDYLIGQPMPPVELIVKSRELDPENGWLALVEAGRLAKDAVERHPARRRDKTQPRFLIKDPELLDKALAAAKDAGELPLFRCYPNELQEERMNLIRPSETLFQQIQEIRVLANQHSWSASMLPLADAIEAKAEQLAAAGDREGFLSLTRTAHDFFPHSLAGSKESLGVLVHFSYLKVTAEIFQKQSAALGLEDSSAQFEQLADDLAAIKAWQTNRFEPVYPSTVHGSIYAGLSSAAFEGVEDVQNPDLDDFEPGRMLMFLIMEHLTLQFVCGLVLIFSLICLLSSLMGGALPKEIAFRLSPAIPFSDAITGALIALLIPLGTYLAITRLTSLGALELSIAHTRCVPQLINLLAAAYLSILLLPPIIKFLTNRHLHGIGLATMPGWTNRVPAALCLVALFCSSLYRFFPTPAVLGAGILLNLAFLFLLIAAAVQTWGPKRNPVARLLGLRSLGTSYAILAIFLMLLNPVLFMRERHWIGLEKVCPCDSPFHLSSIEASFAYEMRERLTTTVRDSSLWD